MTYSFTGTETHVLNIQYLAKNIESINEIIFFKTKKLLVFRRTRQKQNKFLGRTIQHEWIVDETSQQIEWYKGTICILTSKYLYSSQSSCLLFFQILNWIAQDPTNMTSYNKKIFNIHCCTCFECYFSINIK
jgi:hypothetical protein